MNGPLGGKVAVITGATSGIGEATARRFVAEGACVVAVGRNTEHGAALENELDGRAAFVQADVANETGVADTVSAAVERFGRLDCLFNNAGAALPGEIDTITEAEFDTAMRTLLGSVLFGIKHAARVMRPQGGGVIINNSSIAARRARQGGYVYSVAKAAVTHATHLAAVELAPHGIRVNAISPGAIATPIFWGGSEVAAQLPDEDNARKQAKLERNLARATPTPRSGRADDIAAAAVFLASDEASFVNGHDLVVDGGRVWAYHEAALEPVGSAR
jgi:NAD(P)-dependent dehydrogenase (short-subunit alcohol dehydrogenase family)